MSFTISVRLSDGSKFETSVEATWTVEQLKSSIEGDASCEPSLQRLIYKGRILKDPDTLESYGVQAGHTIHLVKGSRPAAAPSSAPRPAAAPTTSSASAGANPFATMFGGAGAGAGTAPTDMASSMQQTLASNPNMMRSMMQSPLMQSLTDNPEFLRQMMLSNPQTRALLERNPEMREVLSDPDTLRQAMRAASDPEYMADMMRRHDQALNHLESIPGSFNHLVRMHHQLAGPMEAGLADAARGSPAESTAPPSTFDRPNTAAAPNPWQPQPASGSSSRTASASAPNPFASLFQAPMPAAAVPQPGSGPAHGGSAAPGMGMPGMGMPGMAGMDTNQMLQMMQNPMVQSMMTSMLSNPDMLRQLEESNPMLRSMLDGNPAMREMMRNPEMMRQMMNPAVIQQASQLMASMGGMPGGMPGAATGATTATGVNPFAAFAPSSSAPVTSTAPTSAAPGPDFASMMASMMGSGATTGTASSASSSGTAPAPAVPAPPAAPTVPAAELYRDQLTQMREMGFNDEALCIRALQSAGGNVQIAIERLFSGGM